MGVLRDVIDIFSDLDLEKIGDVKTKFGSNLTYSGSMSRRSAEGTLQFPLIVSRSIPIETAQVISNACERNAASFVQIVLSMNPEMNTSAGNDGITYLRQFHQNIDTEDSAMNTILHKLEESAIPAQCHVFTTNGYGLQVLKEELACFGADWREGKLNDVCPAKYVKDHKFVLPMTRDEALSTVQKRFQIIKEARGGSKPPGGGQKYPRDINMIDNSVSTGQDLIQIDNSVHNIGTAKVNGSKQYRYAGSDEQLVFKDLLKDNDAKKANELVPTLLHIRVIAREKGSENDGHYIDFVVGVKCMMHPVSSEDMVDNLVDACRNHDGIFKFIRWTTGEISFLKDFLLNMSEYRRDVAKQSSGSSPWWNRLKHLSTLANIKAKTFVNKDIIPNASIVVSAEEVAMIKSRFGFDLMNPSFVAKIMKKFFLFCFIVVDESLEIAHFKYDGQTSYQTVSFTALEKQSADSARQFKEILKAVQRI